jgi:hypothetical protein
MAVTPTSAIPTNRVRDLADKVEGGVVLTVFGFAAAIALTLSLVVSLSLSIQFAALTFITEGLSFGGIITVESNERIRSQTPLRFWPILMVAAGGFLSTYGNLNCWTSCGDSNWRMVALVPMVGVLLVVVGLVLLANRLRNPAVLAER